MFVDSFVTMVFSFGHNNSDEKVKNGRLFFFMLGRFYANIYANQVRSSFFAFVWPFRLSFFRCKVMSTVIIIIINYYFRPNHRNLFDKNCFSYNLKSRAKLSFMKIFLVFFFISCSFCFRPLASGQIMCRLCAHTHTHLLSLPKRRHSS